MFDFKQLEALQGVSEEGTFQRAASRLGLTQPAVSERIRQLEQTAGRPLLIRSSPVVLTEAGMHLIQLFEKHRLLHAAAMSEWGQSEHERARISVAVNFDSLWTWFAPSVAGTSAEKGFLFEVLPMDQSQTISALREGRVLACVTHEKKAPTGCVSQKLGTMEYVCLASKAFKQRYFANSPDKKTIGEIPAVIYGKEDRLHEQFLKKIFPKGHRSPPYHWVPSLYMMQQLVLAGAGYALMPKLKQAPGELIQLFQGVTLRAPLYWHRSSIESPHLEALTRAVMTGAKQLLL